MGGSDRSTHTYIPLLALGRDVLFCIPGCNAVCVLRRYTQQCNMYIQSGTQALVSLDITTAVLERFVDYICTRDTGDIKCCYM